MEAAADRQIAELARFALETTSDAVYCLDPEWRFTYLNPSAERLTERTAAELLGAKVWDEFPGVEESEAGKLFRIARRTGEPIEVDAYHYAPLGTWFELRVFPDEQGLVVFFRDVGDRHRHDVERQQQAERSWRRSRIDDLTGLPNRVHLVDHLAGLAPDEPVALLFIDIDGFKGVNDSLGHDVGDQLLQDLAERLTATIRPGDLLARHGSDEFVVVLEPGDAEVAASLAARIHQVLGEPFDVGGSDLPLSASIGIALGGDACTEGVVADLLDDADTAMDAAKRAGKARSEQFTPELRRRARERLEVVGGLAAALREGQFELFYQPILHLASGEIDAVEALLRWRHPVRGLLAPAAFLDIAEEIGAVVAIGRWALVVAATQATEWRAAGLTLATGVNISARHFSTGTLVADVEHALAASGLPPELLVLELTETAVAGNYAEAVDQLRRIRALGVGIAIDDFGTGYSSLERLATFPFDFLKFDASLIQESGDPRQEVVLHGIVGAVVSIAEAIGVGTLAEGIETEGQRATALALGCARGQGYGIARPMPAGRVADFVASARRSTPADGEPSRA